MTSYKERLNAITTFIFDFDGVFTSGEVLLHDNDFIRTVDVKDSFAVQAASKNGYKIFIITGGTSEEVRERMIELGVEEVYLRSSHKLNVYESVKEKYNLVDEEILYMGDDIPDYKVMQKVGLSACPQDAVLEIKQIVHYQSPFNGGKRCVRDVIEQTMRLHGKWFQEGAEIW